MSVCRVQQTQSNSPPHESTPQFREAVLGQERQASVSAAEVEQHHGDSLSNGLLRRRSSGGWCAETGVAQDLAESALSHSLGGAVETAYLRNDLAEQRRELMQDWADYVQGQ